VSRDLGFESTKKKIGTLGKSPVVEGGDSEVVMASVPKGGEIFTISTT